MQAINWCRKFNAVWFVYGGSRDSEVTSCSENDPARSTSSASGKRLIGQEYDLKEIRMQSRNCPFAVVHRRSESGLIFVIPSEASASAAEKEGFDLNEPIQTVQFWQMSESRAGRPETI